MQNIQPQFEADYTFAVNAPFRLETGERALSPVTVRYAVYGRLNAQRDNAVLVCHALSGSARVGDWWPRLIAPGSLFDCEQYCVIGTNAIGSCYGSSGPRSTNPATGAEYGAEFPLVTVRDMVRAQARVIEHLGISKLHAVIGGSLGGMQALQWTVEFPERMERCIAIGAAPLGGMGLALNHLQRRAIRGGDLALARAIAMCSYKSSALFEERFGRQANRNGEDPLESLDARFGVAGYLDHQGEKFVERFDANSYLLLSKAMDTFDLARGFGSEAEALRRVRAAVTLVGISSDWLFPAADVRSLAARMRAAGVRCGSAELGSNHGHDAFLAEPEALFALLRDVLPAAGVRKAATSSGTNVGGAMICR